MKSNVESRISNLELGMKIKENRYLILSYLKFRGFDSIDREFLSRKLINKNMEAYCVKCKAKKEMNGPEEIKMKNGRPAVTGTCPDCGTKMFKIGAMKKDE